MRTWCGVAAVLWAAGCSCGETSATDAGDAARDSAPGEPVDMGVDTRRDTGRDGGRDAGVDAGPIGEAGWVPLPGLPEGCVIERAEHPEVLFEPEWLSCGEGCEYLGPEAGIPRAYDRVGWHDGARWWFAVIQSTDDSRHREVVLAPSDGPAVAAWRGPNGWGDGLCIIGPNPIGDGSAAFGVQVLGGDLPEQFRLYHAPLNEIGRVTEPIAVREPSMGPGSSGVQRLSVSRTTVAAEVQPVGVVIVFEGGATRVLGGLSSPIPGIPQNSKIVGRTVWWEEWRHPTSLVTGTVDRDARYFLRNVPDDAFVLGVDGGEMAWLQGYGWGGAGAQYERIELWTAPYTDDVAELRPRRVREIGSWGRAVLGAGVYGFFGGDPGGGNPRIHLYDIADGRHRNFWYPEGVSVAESPYGISADEMLLGGRFVVDRFNIFPTLYRIQLASIPYEE